MEQHGANKVKEGLTAVKKWVPWCTRDRVLFTLLLLMGVINLLFNMYAAYP